MPFADGYLVEKTQAEVEREVNATIKLVMEELERLAGEPPELAAEPVTFNQSRKAVVRRIWNMAKECIRYGAIAAQQAERHQ